MKRGEIWQVDLDPTQGTEQRGRRPVLILSQAEFNAKFPALICPITGGGDAGRSAGFTVPLSGLGLKTDGVVLCHQIRAIDLKARNGKRIEAGPAILVEAVTAVLADILE